MKSIFIVTCNRKNWNNLHILHRFNLIVFSFIFPSILSIEIDEKNNIEEWEIKFTKD